MISDKLIKETEAIATQDKLNRDNNIFVNNLEPGFGYILEHKTTKERIIGVYSVLGSDGFLNFPFGSTQGTSPRYLWSTWDIVAKLNIKTLELFQMKG